MFGMILHGFGGSILYTVGVGLIDDSVDSVNSPLYIGKGLYFKSAIFLLEYYLLLPLPSKIFSFSFPLFFSFSSSSFFFTFYFPLFSIFFLFFFPFLLLLFSPSSFFFTFYFPFFFFIYFFFLFFFFFYFFFCFPLFSILFSFYFSSFCSRLYALLLSRTPWWRTPSSSVLISRRPAFCTLFETHQCCFPKR